MYIHVDITRLPLPPSYFILFAVHAFQFDTPSAWHLPIFR